MHLGAATFPGTPAVPTGWAQGTSLCTDRLLPGISPKDAAARSDAPTGELVEGETRLWRILKVEASRGPGKPVSVLGAPARHTPGTQRCHTARRSSRAAGGEREGGKAGGESPSPARPRVAPSPPFAPAVVAPGATAPSGEDSSTPSGTGEAGGVCAWVAFLLGKRVEIGPVLRPCRPPGAAGPAGRPAPPALPFGGDMVLAEGFRTAGPGPPAVPRRSSHRTIECGAAAQSAPPHAPNHRVELRPAWISWSASCSTRPPSGAVSLAANIQESHTRISHCQEQARSHRHVSAARKTEMEVTIVFPCILQHCSTFSSGK